MPGGVALRFVAGLMVVAACAADVPADDAPRQPERRAAWPNEPDGFQVVTDQPWSRHSGDEEGVSGWVRLWSNT